MKHHLLAIGLGLLASMAPVMAAPLFTASGVFDTPSLSGPAASALASNLGIAAGTSFSFSITPATADTVSDPAQGTYLGQVYELRIGGVTVISNTVAGSGARINVFDLPGSDTLSFLFLRSGDLFSNVIGEESFSFALTTASAADIFAGDALPMVLPGTPFIGNLQLTDQAPIDGSSITAQVSGASVMAAQTAVIPEAASGLLLFLPLAGLMLSGWRRCRPIPVRRRILR